MELIGEGAESKIYLTKDKTLLKIREKKTYRLEEIDNKLRKARNKREFKVLTKLLEQKINAPKPIKINEKDFSFEFEYIQGNILKQVLNEKLLNKAFQEIIKLHNSHIIHGDLTTLNMLEKNQEIYLIDFGLSEFSEDIEQKAVDLNLFFNCIKNEHPTLYTKKGNLIESYKKQSIKGKEIIQRLEQVEKRGRNKK